MEGRDEVLAAAEAELVRRVDAAVAAAAARAGRHLTCALGCTACCIGPFPITVLDSRRLRSGLAELESTRPWEADAVAARARAQWAEMAPTFPGEARTGALDDDEVARTSFAERFAAVPCPALDPRSGACRLYDARPLACRLFGLPVRVEDDLETPCELNFTAAGLEEVAQAQVEADPGGLEARLLTLIGDPPETTVAAVLAIAESEL